MRNSIAAFACLVALAGCGSDGTSSPQGAASSAPTSSAPAGPPVTLTGTVNDRGTGDATSGQLAVDLGDSFFAPTYIKVAPGAKVTFQLKNSGAMPHTFTIDQPKVDVTVDAGGTGTAGLTMPASGALALYCKFHKTQGMQGALYVNAGDPVSGGTSGDGAPPYGG